MYVDGNHKRRVASVGNNIICSHVVVTWRRSTSVVRSLKFLALPHPSSLSQSTSSYQLAKTGWLRFWPIWIGIPGDSNTYLSPLYNLLLEVLIKIISLINSSSTVLVFVDKDSLIKKHNIIIKRLLVLKPLCLTNRLLSSFITHYFTVKMIIGHYIEFILFYITKLLLLILVILKMP